MTIISQRKEGKLLKARVSQPTESQKELNKALLDRGILDKIQKEMEGC